MVRLLQWSVVVALFGVACLLLTPSLGTVQDLSSNPAVAGSRGGGGKSSSSCWYVYYRCKPSCSTSSSFKSSSTKSWELYGCYRCAKDAICESSELRKEGHQVKVQRGECCSGCQSENNEG